MGLREIRIAFLAAFALVAALLPAHARAADPVGTTPCSGVRPGALVTAGGTDFTMGFLYKGSDKHVYVATVGHFVQRTDGTKVWRSYKGPSARDAANRKIGAFAYAHTTGLSDGATNFTTFGLIRLTKTTKYNGRVCHFGGPTGTYTSRATDPVVLNFYGQDIEFILLPARSALAPLGTPDAGWIYMTQPVIDVGDGGAPVLIGGKAAGIIALGQGATTGTSRPQAGFLVSRIAPWITAAQKALKIRLSLIKAPTS